MACDAFYGFPMQGKKGGAATPTHAMVLDLGKVYFMQLCI